MSAAVRVVIRVCKPVRLLTFDNMIRDIFSTAGKFEIFLMIFSKYSVSRFSKK
jgi:hypothetical protein